MKSVYKLKMKTNLYIKPGMYNADKLKSLILCVLEFQYIFRGFNNAQLLSALFLNASIIFTNKNTVNVSFRFKRLKIFGPVSKASF